MMSEILDLSDVFLWELCESLGNKWESVCYHLGIKNADIESAKKKGSSMTGHSLLIDWRRNIPGNQDKRKLLAIALTKAHCTEIAEHHGLIQVRLQSSQQYNLHQQSHPGNIPSYQQPLNQSIPQDHFQHSASQPPPTSQYNSPGHAPMHGSMTGQNQPSTMFASDQSDQQQPCQQQPPYPHSSQSPGYATPPQDSYQQLPHQPSPMSQYNLPGLAPRFNPHTGKRFYPPPTTTPPRANTTLDQQPDLEVSHQQRNPQQLSYPSNMNYQQPPYPHSSQSPGYATPPPASYQQLPYQHPPFSYHPPWLPPPYMAPILYPGQFFPQPANDTFSAYSVAMKIKLEGKIVVEIQHDVLANSHLAENCSKIMRSLLPNGTEVMGTPKSRCLQFLVTFISVIAIDETWELCQNGTIARSYEKFCSEYLKKQLGHENKYSLTALMNPKEYLHCRKLLIFGVNSIARVGSHEVINEQSGSFALSYCYPNLESLDLATTIPNSPSWRLKQATTRWELQQLWKTKINFEQLQVSSMKKIIF